MTAMAANLADKLIIDGRQAAILNFVSDDYLTNAWVDWSDYIVAYWGDWRNVPLDDQRRSSLIQDGRHGSHLYLVSIDSLTNARVNWSEIYVGYWG
jgi:hypothetical protein